MILQNILFPRKGICTDTEMYFREADTGLSLDTYFNSFSIGKWRKYTKLTNLKLVLEFENVENAYPTIKAYTAVGSKTKVVDVYSPKEDEYLDGIESKISEASANVFWEGNRAVVEFNELSEEGILYVDIQRTNGDFTLVSGYYETQIAEEELNNVNIVLGICTFKREESVKKNVSQILEELINNQASPLYGHLEVCISDNGQTLSLDLFNSDKVKLFYNKNAGGAGGFTRTMIESIFNRPGDFSHIILMDDDIELDCNVIERTYTLLRMVKAEYKKATVAGAMLELKKRYQQFECGANFEGILITSFNHGWDMRKAVAVAANEYENNIRYSGWWYSCIPTEVITEDNLPLPQFIHYDDIEYGTRNSANGTIMMNGLCVWHPYGFNKQPIAMNYYDMRNLLIAAAGLPIKAKTLSVAIRFFGVYAQELILYRYDSGDRFAEGLEDFFKGVDYFMQLDPIEKHADLAARNIKYEEPVGIDLSKIENNGVEQQLPHAAVLSALCWLLPAHNKERVIGIYDTGATYRTKRLYFYDENRKMGYWLKKQYSMFIPRVCRCIKDTFIILFTYKKKALEWESRKSEYTNLEFWKRYLEL